MPQLSPLNWILLFFLFWVAVLAVSVLIWWSSKLVYSSKSSDSVKLEENKWTW
uniref:ATP synthase complex subunit 8 n=1 Tax=Mitromorpha fischeri TaxID=2259836 RepID=A0A344H1V6_9COND|nr:ATP synthase F0 subunit 8 [Mitromorpha fischeri]